MIVFLLFLHCELTFSLVIPYFFQNPLLLQPREFFLFVCFFLRLISYQIYPGNYYTQELITTYALLHVHGHVDA